MTTLPGRIFLDGNFSFSTLDISCHLLLTCKISAEKTADSLAGVSLQIVLSLAVFKILSLSLILTFSVQFICSVVSDSLQPHGLQHARLPHPSPSTRVCSNACPLTQWCHPNHLIHCRPLLLLPSVFPSIRVFSNESTLRMRWPKYWSFSFNISPSSEHPGLISFRMD